MPGVIVRFTESHVVGGVTFYDAKLRFGFDPDGDIDKQTTELVVTLLAETLSESGSSRPAFRPPLDDSDVRS